MDSFEIEKLTADVVQNLSYLQSLPQPFEQLGKCDFVALHANRAALQEAYNLWKVRATDASVALGELALILASIELHYGESDVTTFDVINELLSDENARAAILSVYVPADMQADIGELTFFRAGTTSFIFRSTKYHHGMVLKAVAAPYCFDPRVIKHTAAYARTYAELFDESITPVRAERSGDRFVWMAYADGVELSDFCAHELGTGRDLLRRVELARTITIQLFDCLEVMENLGLAHLDMNPKNLICGKNAQGLITLRVLDFGRNHVLTEGLGSAPRIQRVAEYVAPEVQSMTEQPTGIASDLYSVGKILLDILKPGWGPGVSRSERLKGLYQEAPSLAGVVEDLMSPIPQFRTDRAPPGQLISLTRSRLFLAYSLTAKLDAPNGEMSLTIRRGVVSALRGSLMTRIRQLHGMAKVESAAAGRKSRRGHFLLEWSITVWIGYMAAWLFFVFLTLRDLHIAWGPFSALSVGGAISLPADAHAFASNLPGRLVILSFVIISADYYMNILSGLSFWGFSDWRTRLTEVWIRFSAVSCLPLAVFVYFVDPQSWALCSAIGTTCIAINNTFMYFTCKRLLDAPTGFGEVITTVESGRADLEEFFRFQEYGSWASLMFGYSVMLLLVGLLLSFGLAHDVWVYAAIFIAANIFKIEWSNCVSQAPKVRGNLARVVSLAERGLGS